MQGNEILADAFGTRSWGLEPTRIVIPRPQDPKPSSPQDLKTSRPIVRRVSDA